MAEPAAGEAPQTATEAVRRGGGAPGGHPPARPRPPGSSRSGPTEGNTVARNVLSGPYPQGYSAPSKAR